MSVATRFTLYSGPLSMFAAKAQIAAPEKGLDFELVMVPFDFRALYTPKHPEVLRINPKAQLAGRDFLAGPLTFADIAFYMAALFGERQGAPLGDETPRLLRWRERMTQRPAVGAVVGPMAAWLANAGWPVPAFMKGL